jgi:L-ascorbate metabolism protein UlaG (beta-lactamase superfamily)
VPASIQITYLGNATVILEMDGLRLLTDPLLRDNDFYFRRRSAAVEASLYQNIDVVLNSHLHWDHFDLPSLRLLGKKTHLIVPAGAGGMLQSPRLASPIHWRTFYLRWLSWYRPIRRRTAPRLPGL